MRENSARTSTRWGARVERSVVGLSTVDIAQFVDVNLLAPQQLAIALYAFTDAPIPGISVDWILSLGNGSMSHSELLTVAVTDIASQVPVTMLRPASTVLLSARIRSVIPETKLVRLVGLIAPSSPTWMTDLACREEK